MPYSLETPPKIVHVLKKKTAGTQTLKTIKTIRSVLIMPPCFADQRTDCFIKLGLVPLVPLVPTTISL